MSEIDICNQALASFGARSVINSFDEVSKEAINCKLFYNPVRKSLLRAAHWGFARKQVLLSELGNLQDGTAPYPWQYKYAYPADCERFRYLVPMPTNTNAQGDAIPATDVSFWPLPGPSRNWPYLIANDTDKRCLLTNVQFAIGVYTADVQNTDLWDSLFVQAMVAAMAAKLCFNISGKGQFIDEFRNQAQEAVMIARAADGNEAQPTTDHTPDWITARGYPWGYPSLYSLTTASLGNGNGTWFQGPESWGM